MNNRSRCSRRTFLDRSGVGIGLTSVIGWNQLSSRLRADESLPEAAQWVRGIVDAEIRTGVETAIVKNLLPAISERLYPGQFTITADGMAFGGDTTWPGLDSWQMAGAYLLLKYERLVLDYFEFIRASQRKDGNIPFAIFPGDTRSDGKWLRGLKSPEDVFSYTPPTRDGLPPSSQQTRKWIGLFEHWQPKANPLSTLGPVCYLLTAAEIFDATGSLAWLRERIPSLETTAKYLASRKSDNGLIDGSGFYMEMPPRYGWDGVTQCYVIHAFRELARLFRAAGDEAGATTWGGHADALAKDFHGCLLAPGPFRRVRSCRPRADRCARSLRCELGSCGVWNCQRRPACAAVATTDGGFWFLARRHADADRYKALCLRALGTSRTATVCRFVTRE